MDIQRQNQRCKERQSSLSELSEIELNRIYTMDEYSTDYYIFKVMEYDVAVKDDLLGEAIESLPVQRRGIVLLSYFLGYNDKEIAGLLDLMQYTVKYHRRTALKDLKERLEGQTSEQK